MFPEYRELITQLKSKDAHFTKLFNAHNQLDDDISKIENDPIQVASRNAEIEQMKRQKLALKDEIGQYLKSKSL